MGKQVILKEVAINWPRIAKAEKNPNYPANPPTYNICAILDPEKHADIIEQIQAGIDEAAALSTAKKPADVPNTWEPKANGKREIRITAAENWNRQVVDEQLNPVDPMTTPGKFYSGAICNIAMDVYYTGNYNKVCFGLLAVQFVRDGERLDNQPQADELFAPIQVSGNNPDPLG